MSTVQLEPNEARVLGVLVEKAMTTPEQYPLSLNAATSGSNQKSNRFPVLELLESEVYAALQSLIRKGIVGSIHQHGSRIERFCHNGEALLEVDSPQLAVLAELLMRGPQTPGDLRTRASRMAAIDSLPRLMEILQPLIERGLVRRLPPPPGSRAELYAQCIAPNAHPLGGAGPSMIGQPATAQAASTPRASAPSTPAAAPSAARSEAPTPAKHAEPDDKLARRVAELETEVVRLRRQLGNLAWQLNKKLES